jgi:DNA-binding protein H-NS
MTDPNLLRKERQDEARRQQQADERIRELEETLLEIMDYIEGRQNGPMSSDIDPDSIWSIANRALDGGGDADE